MAIELWVDGREYQASSARTLPVEDPATGEVVDELRLADSADLDHVVRVARAAQAEWARTPLAKRVDVMFKFRQLIIEHQDELADIIVREGGKTHGDALGEIARGRETVDFACGINAALKGEFTDQASTGVDVHTLRQPVGVVAGIAPFNFPVMVPMWMHPIALATGNAFILKVASLVPSASLCIARLYKEAGLPDGLFNVIAGDRTLVGEILTHDGIDAISFVGSSPVAHVIQDTGTSHGKRVQALGGANNHAIIMPDADIEFAAQHISAGAFGAAGQRCMALPVIVAVGGVEEKLVPAIKARAEKIVVAGNGSRGGDGARHHALLAPAHREVDRGRRGGGGAGGPRRARLPPGGRGVRQRLLAGPDDPGRSGPRPAGVPRGGVRARPGGRARRHL